MGFLTVFKGLIVNEITNYIAFVKSLTASIPAANTACLRGW